MPQSGDVAPEGCPSNVWERADERQGWLTREEAGLLWRYAEFPWCEVGTYKGRSTEVLAARGNGYAVDLYLDWYSVPLVLEGVTVVRGDFRDVVDEVPDGLAFLHLDADHSYEGTHAAWRLYSPKVVVGGHAAIHDALELHRGQLDWPEVNDFVHDQIIASTDWRLVAAAHRTVVFRREA